MEDNTVYISLNQSGRQKYPHSLVLPPQISKVSSCASGFVTVQPLKELCLSLIWRAEQCTNHSSAVGEIGLCLEDPTPVMLPKALLDLLEVGPVSWCNNTRCQSPIFTFASIIVVTIAVSPKAYTDVSKMPMLMYFCSDICADNFTKSVDDKRDRLSCWLSQKLKTQHCIKVL